VEVVFGQVKLKIKNNKKSNIMQNFRALQGEIGSLEREENHKMLLFNNLQTRFYEQMKGF